jgi:hypothetical protein
MSKYPYVSDYEYDSPPFNQNVLAHRYLPSPNIVFPHYDAVRDTLPPECKAKIVEESQSGADWTPEDWKTRRCRRCPYRPPGSQYSEENRRPGRDGPVFGCGMCHWALYLDDERVNLYPPQKEDITVCFCNQPSAECSAAPSGSLGYELWVCKREYCSYYRTVPLPKPRRYTVGGPNKNLLVLVPDEEDHSPSPANKGSGLKNMTLAEP